MDVREQFNALIKSKGYSSLNEFCNKNDIDYGNMHRRLTGVKQKIEIPFAFRVANILRVPVDDIIKLFYPEEYKENQSIID